MLANRVMGIGIALVAIAACDDTPPSGKPQTRTASPIWIDSTNWHIEEDLRLGTLGGADWSPQQFENVQDIATDSRGRLFVLDWISQEVRVFLADGSYSHTIGRRGPGPGEFVAASTLVIGAGDTLTVLDDGNMRYSVFDSTGAFVDQYPRPIIGRGSPLQSYMKGGGYVDWQPEMPDGRMGERIHYYPVFFSEAFSRADTFPPIVHYQVMAESNRPLFQFGPTIIAAANASGGIWFANSHNSIIYRRNLSGDTVDVIRLVGRPPALADSDREFVRHRWRRRPDVLPGQLEALPETRPFIHAIVPDNSGHVYVLLDIVGEERGTVVEVFREAGDYIGRVRLPTAIALPRFPPPVMHASVDHIYGVVMDSMDVPYVVRFRITRRDRRTGD